VDRHDPKVRWDKSRRDDRRIGVRVI
jgi:hypothetical protein